MSFGSGTPGYDDQPSLGLSAQVPNTNYPGDILAALQWAGYQFPAQGIPSFSSLNPLPGQSPSALWNNPPVVTSVGGSTLLGSGPAAGSSQVDNNMSAVNPHVFQRTASILGTSGGAAAQARTQVTASVNSTQFLRSFSPSETASNLTMPSSVESPLKYLLERVLTAAATSQSTTTQQQSEFSADKAVPATPQLLFDVNSHFASRHDDGRLEDELTSDPVEQFVSLHAPYVQVSSLLALALMNRFYFAILNQTGGDAQNLNEPMLDGFQQQNSAFRYSQETVDIIGSRPMRAFELNFAGTQIKGVGAGTPDALAEAMVLVVREIERFPEIHARIKLFMQPELNTLDVQARPERTLGESASVSYVPVPSRQDVASVPISATYNLGGVSIGVGEVSNLEIVKAMKERPEQSIASNTGPASYAPSALSAGFGSGSTTELSNLALIERPTRTVQFNADILAAPPVAIAAGTQQPAPSLPARRSASEMIAELRKVPVKPLSNPVTEKPSNDLGSQDLRKGSIVNNEITSPPPSAAKETLRAERKETLESHGLDTAQQLLDLLITQGALEDAKPSSLPVDSKRKRSPSPKIATVTAAPRDGQRKSGKPLTSTAKDAPRAARSRSRIRARRTSRARSRSRSRPPSRGTSRSRRLGRRSRRSRSPSRRSRSRTRRSRSRSRRRSMRRSRSPHRRRDRRSRSPSKERCDPGLICGKPQKQFVQSKKQTASSQMQQAAASEQSSAQPKLQAPPKPVAPPVCNAVEKKCEPQLANPSLLLIGGDLAVQTSKEGVQPHLLIQKDVHQLRQDEQSYQVQEHWRQHQGDRSHEEQEQQPPKFPTTEPELTRFVLAMNIPHGPEHERKSTWHRVAIPDENILPQLLPSDALPWTDIFNLSCEDEGRCVLFQYVLRPFVYGFRSEKEARETAWGYVCDPVDPASSVERANHDALYNYLRQMRDLCRENNFHPGNALLPTAFKDRANKLQKIARKTLRRIFGCTLALPAELLTVTNIAIPLARLMEGELRIWLPRVDQWCFDRLQFPVLSQGLNEPSVLSEPDMSASAFFALVFALRRRVTYLLLDHLAMGPSDGSWRQAQETRIRIARGLPPHPRAAELASASVPKRRKVRRPMRGAKAPTTQQVVPLCALQLRKQ